MHRTSAGGPLLALARAGASVSLEPCEERWSGVSVAVRQALYPRPKASHPDAPEPWRKAGAFLLSVLGGPRAQTPWIAGLGWLQHWLRPLGEMQHRVSKLDRLSGTPSSGLMARRVGPCWRTPDATRTRLCCTSMQLWPRAASCSEWTRAALQAKRAAGEGLGNPANLCAAGNAGRAAQRQAPDRFVLERCPSWMAFAELVRGLR